MKQYFSNLTVDHRLVIDNCWKEKDEKMMQQNEKNHLFFIPYILLPCQNLMITLATMQHQPSTVWQEIKACYASSL